MTLGLTSHLIHFDYKPRKFLSNKTSITLYVIQYTYSLERYLWVDSLCKWYYTISLPDDVSFVEGAALPVIFATAYYALHQVARIREGESVLIHSAAGGTGQAAIQIAQMAKANIFATVGSNEKRDLLIDLYGIPSDHIFCSRNGTFARGINRMLRETGGVDIALNSLSGSALVDTFECMAPYGRFLEIGKKDILDHGSLPMFPFAENVSFHAIDLSSIQEYRSEVFREIQRTITRLLCARKIRPPQPVHVYGVGDTEKAFRYLQGGMNTGKTVVELRPDDLVKVSL
jgi:NADPH:quinone reductase-like Zn-dependent oxidoreductase